MRLSVSLSRAVLPWLRGSFVTSVPEMLMRCLPGCRPRILSRETTSRRRAAPRAGASGLGVRHRSALFSCGRVFARGDRELLQGAPDPVGRRQRSLQLLERPLELGPAGREIGESVGAVFVPRVVTFGHVKGK